MRAGVAGLCGDGLGVPAAAAGGRVPGSGAGAGRRAEALGRTATGLLSAIVHAGLGATVPVGLGATVAVGPGSTVAVGRGSVVGSGEPAGEAVGVAVGEGAGAGAERVVVGVGVGSVGLGSDGVGCGVGGSVGDGTGDGRGAGVPVGVGRTDPVVGGGAGGAGGRDPGSGAADMSGAAGRISGGDHHAVVVTGPGVGRTGGVTAGWPVAGTGTTTGPTDGVGMNRVRLSGRAVLPTVADPALIAARIGIDAVPASSATVNR